MRDLLGLSKVGTTTSTPKRAVFSVTLHLHNFFLWGGLAGTMDGVASLPLWGPVFEPSSCLVYFRLFISLNYPVEQRLGVLGGI